MIKRLVFASATLIGVLFAGGVVDASRNRLGDLTPTDWVFLQVAGQIGDTAAARDQLARTHTRNPRVLDLARTGASMQERYAADVAVLVRQHHVAAGAPTYWERSANKQLSGLYYSAFDKMYLEESKSESQRALFYFKRAALDSKNDDVRAFAARALPSLYDQLERATALQNEVAGGRK